MTADEILWSLSMQIVGEMDYIVFENDGCWRSSFEVRRSRGYNCFRDVFLESPP